MVPSRSPSDDAKSAFDALGFHIQRSFLNPETTAALCRLARQDPAMKQHSHAVLDADGRESRLTLWYAPGADAFGHLSSCSEMIETMSVLLGGRASFFHAKLMQKLPQSGGSWEWHQDYGYWYRDGFLRPEMGSCYVALEEATVANGCLHVIAGSHHFGRLDHVAIGEQIGADPERVDALVARLGVTPCELRAGDALFFHANLLHMSGPNRSEDSRLGLITSFFREDNESIHDDPRFKNKTYPTPSLTDLVVKGGLSEDVPFLAGQRPLG